MSNRYTMYKLIHIHTDQKFIYETTRYIDERVFNKVLFLGHVSDELESKLEKLNLTYSIIPKNDAAIIRISELLDDSDAVVINKLCRITTRLLKSLPNHTKVLLRLFGF